MLSPRMNIPRFHSTACCPSSSNATPIQRPDAVMINAHFYVRVLENPKCRWSTWDAIRAGVEPRPDLPATIQDRAWSSPVWTGR